MTTAAEDYAAEFDEASREAVELGNRLLDQDPEADQWEVASGLLAGAVQFWLYSRQPCDDPMCEACAEIGTAQKRLEQLLEETRQFAAESEYFHSPRDSNVGTA